MAADRLAITAWLATLADTLVDDAIDADSIAIRLDKAATLEDAAFALETFSIMRVIAESVDVPAGFDAITLPAASEDTLAAATVLAAFGLSIAAPRVAWISRPQARAARSRISSYGDVARAYVSARGAEMLDLYGYLSRLVEVAVLIVSDQAANAVPIVRVETGISMPSTVLAYQLYGEADRAQGLVEIARSATPMLMPIAFDALET